MTTIDMQVNGETITISNLSPYAPEWASALLALDLNARRDLDAKVWEEFVMQGYHSKLSEVYQAVLIKELRAAIMSYVAKETSVVGFPINADHAENFELQMGDDVEFCVGDGAASMMFQSEEVTSALALVTKLHDIVEGYLETGEY